MKTKDVISVYTLKFVTWKRRISDMLGLVCYIVYYSDPDCLTATGLSSVVSEFSSIPVTFDLVFPTKCNSGQVNIYANFDPVSTTQLLDRNNVTLNYIFYNGSYISASGSRGCTEVDDASLYQPFNHLSQTNRFWYKLTDFENPCSTPANTHEHHTHDSDASGLFVFIFFFSLILISYTLSVVLLAKCEQYEDYY